jgi:septal ring factor EnvC (AmiA/AmiB activator)
MTVDWDRELLTAQLADIDAEIDTLERAISRTRDWIASAEREDAAFRERVSAIETALVDLRVQARATAGPPSRSGGTTTPSAEATRQYDALEARWQQQHDKHHAWVHAPEAAIPFNPPRPGRSIKAWSNRDLGALRTRLAEFTADLEKAHASRAAIAANLAALDAPQTAPETPQARPWHDRLLRGG